MEGSALLELTFDIQGRLVSFENVLDDRQPQPNAAVITTSAGIDAKETFGQTWDGVRRQRRFRLSATVSKPPSASLLQQSVMLPLSGV